MTPSEFTQHRDNLALGLEKYAEINYWPLATAAEALVALGMEVEGAATNTYLVSYNLYLAAAERIRGCQTAEEVLEAYSAMLNLEVPSPSARE